MRLSVAKRTRAATCYGMYERSFFSLILWRRVHSKSPPVRGVCIWVCPINYDTRLCFGRKHLTNMIRRRLGTFITPDLANYCHQSCVLSKTLKQWEFCLCAKHSLCFDAHQKKLQTKKWLQVVLNSSNMLCSSTTTTVGKSEKTNRRFLMAIYQIVDAAKDLDWVEVGTNKYYRIFYVRCTSYQKQMMRSPRPFTPKFPTTIQKDSIPWDIDENNSLKTSASSYET